MLLYLLCSSFLIGCANGPTTYRLALGARKELYTEKYGVPLDTTLAQQLGGTVTTLSGDRSQGRVWTDGFQLGLTEELSSGIVSELAFFYNRYSPLNYSFNSSTYGDFSETITSTGRGLDASIGYRWRWLRPYISYKIESVSSEVTVRGSAPATASSYTNSLFVWGGGFAFDIPLAKYFYLVVQGDYRVPSNKGTDGTTASYQSLQVNLLIGNWQVSADNKKSSNSKK